MNTEKDVEKNVENRVENDVANDAIKDVEKIEKKSPVQEEKIASQATFAEEQVEKEDNTVKFQNLLDLLAKDTDCKFEAFLNKTDLDGNNYFVGIGCCDSIVELNQSLVPFAIEALAEFLVIHPTYRLFEQTEILDTKNESLLMLRDIHDNLTRNTSGRIFGRVTLPEWKDFLTDTLGNSEAAFLLRKPVYTDILQVKWNYKSLLEILFGERFVVVAENEFGAISESDVEGMEGIGMDVLFAIIEEKKDKENDRKNNEEKVV